MRARGCVCVLRQGLEPCVWAAAGLRAVRACCGGGVQAKFLGAGTFRLTVWPFFTGLRSHWLTAGLLEGFWKFDFLATGL